MKTLKNTFYIAVYLKRNQVGTVDTDGKVNYSDNLDFNSWKHFQTKKEAQSFADNLLENETEELHPTFEYVVEEWDHAYYTDNV